MSTNIVKNDPSRFLGEGMPFRAKLIGVLQVPEARGDRMCQEALADLKMAIRAAGEHKQRITVHVAIDGLRLRDDKTGDSLYHHPVHKISFIAQDMQDSRAFGYIFGSPDSGHRFFGIKTDKAASNVVMSMRDLFQVVFELKKREIELAKQQLEAKSVISIQRQIANITSDIKTKSPLSLGETSTSTAKVTESNADGGVAELVDLEQELSSLRRGLTQVEGLTPPGDPFGDSFTAPTSQKSLLPPPPSGSSSRGRSTPSTSAQQSRAVFSPNKTTTATLPFDLPTAPAPEFEPAVAAPASVVDDDLEPVSVISRESAATSLSYDVFTDLDPLGTGKNKPYVDKKLFFQELKNPPKKVLKDLVPNSNTALIPEALSSTEIEAKIDQTSVPTSMTSMSRHSGGSVTVVKQPQSTYSSSCFATDPFAETDPFDSADPFSDSFKDDPFSNLQDLSKSSLKSESIQSETKSSIDDDLPIFQEITKSNAVDVIQSYMRRSMKQSLKTEMSNFEEYSKSLSVLRYDDLISSSKIRESSIDYRGGEERSLDGRRGGEKGLDGSRGGERIAYERRGKELTFDDLRRRSRAKWLDGRRGEERSLDGGLVFNGPLQVTLPPEATPKSPRLKRQKADTSSIRQRPQPASKLSLSEAASPPPLPPKKAGDLTANRPPPRPPLDDDNKEGPPLPPPSRKKEPLPDRSIKPAVSVATNSSEDEYLSPAPPPLPTGRRFDITLTHLLTCTVQDLSERLRVPVSTLSSMTLPQLTTYLRSYLAADTDRTHIHVDPTMPVAQPIKHNKEPQISASPPISISGLSTKTLPNPSKPKLYTKSDQFEDDFAPTTETNGTFVANFDDFDKKANSSYDRYAAFREIQEQELKITILNNHDETKQNGSLKEDSDKEEISTEVIKDDIERLENRSPLKSLDELTLNSFNMFRKTASPKPSQIDSKIEDVKNVMKNLQIEQCRRSVSPRENVTFSDLKREDRNDRYAALREITVTEPQDEFESIPSENQPKERKRSDEKSDGFDNSDFFDCIDNNSSLSYSHVDDAFRKSPSVKEKEVKVVVTPQKEPEVRLVPQPPPRLSTGSFSDMASASSPEIKVTGREEWSVSAARGRRGSPLSSDSSQGSRRRATRKPRRRQTSSSSRDASPWDEAPRAHRTHTHHSRHNSSAGSRECIDSANSRDKDKLRDKRERDRDSRGSRESSARERDRRQNSSAGSRECIDSANSRDKDKLRDKRERDRDSRGSRESSARERDRRSSSKERDHRRDRKRSERDRNRDTDKWDRDRNRDYSRERETKSTREYRSRERGKEHRDKERERDRHRGSQRSWHDEDDYSDGCGSGRSSPRERWSEHSRWRRDDHKYGSLGYRDSRRRNDSRQSEEGSDRRYGSTLSWGSGRRSGSARRDPERRRTKRDDSTRHRAHETRFSNDYSPRERKNSSPFENESVDETIDETPAPPVLNKKRQPYSTLEGARFAFEEDTTASPQSASSGRAPPPRGGGGSPASRFRFDSDSVSPKSMFEDDFCLPPPTTPRIRTASIAEEEENDLPPLRTKPYKESKEQVIPIHKDIKKSESVNIFVRENDPFENDDFFACTGSDKAARRENWPSDFQAFDNV